MGFIRCPECGIKISDKALCCPHCGFVSNDRNLPISVQDKYISVPKFKYLVQEWKPIENTYLSADDNKTLVNYFGNWEVIQAKIPALAEIIQAMAQKENYLVAEIPKYINKLINKGIYQFNMDKNGEIVPTIRDSKGIVKQVRLKNMSFNPNITHSMVNLSNQVMMEKILAEIEYIGNEIKSIHTELQNDRLALTDASIQELQQAMLIEDSKLRSIALLNAINKATEAKCILIRNYKSNYEFIKKEKNKNWIAHIKDLHNDTEIKAKDALMDIVSITNAVQIECLGYAALGEYESERECLSQFKSFITDNKLTDRNTLLTINEGLSVKQLKVIEQFETISNKISSFEENGLLNYNENLLFIGGKKYE